MRSSDDTRERILRLLEQVDKLPTLPLVAVRLLGVTGDELGSPRDVAKLIESDQSLTAKTLKMANSAFYGRSGAISTIRDAVVLIGFNAVRSTVLSLAVMDLFRSRPSSNGFDPEAFWVHSLACAICAREISRRVDAGTQKAEEAFVCGMLHDVGKVLLDHHLPDLYEEVIRHVEKHRVVVGEAEERVLGVDHTEVGSALLRLWKLPEHQTEAIARHHRLPSFTASVNGSTRLAGIVNLADTVVRIHRLGSGGDSVPRIVDPSLRDALGLGEEGLAEVAAGIEEKVREAAGVLDIQLPANRSQFDVLHESNREMTLLRSLSETDARYRLLFESFPDAIFLMSDVIFDCNEQACRLFGRNRNDIVDNGLETFFAEAPGEGDMAAEAFRAHQRAALAGEPRYFHTRIRRGDGTCIEAEVSMMAFPVGQHAVLQTTIRDVTERRRMERALAREIVERRKREAEIRQLNERLEQQVKARTAELEKAYEDLKKLDSLKDSFLSLTSHELRTPLTSIRSFSEILLNYDEDADTRREFLSIINTESERLTRLINDVLDLSKIAAGKMVYKDELFALGEVIADVARRDEQALHEKALTLQLDLPPELPPVYADRDRIQQVIGNLLSNAVKFSPAGRSIWVRTEGFEGRRFREPPEWITLSIRDEGMGIDEKDFEVIFDKFSQVSTDTLKDKPKGTGLGLPICKEIISHYGGNIWVESHRGMGSTFFFTLPTITRRPLVKAEKPDRDPASPADR